ncbi:MAG TPA: hypothetical protein VJG13_06730 [Thermoanaerobaculia bacterium]|nr:hypothetical protein [Thermoanaerobaculia bacterium]
MRIETRPTGMVLAVLLAGALLPSTLHAAPARASLEGIVELEVQAHGGEPFRASLWAGQAATFRSERHGLELRIVPAALDLSSGDVTLEVAETLRNPVLRGMSRGLEALAEVTQVAARAGFRQPLAHFPVDVRVLEVRRPTHAEMMAAQASRLGASLLSKTRSPGDDIVPVESCCVTCGGDTLCGCRVSATCGGCCDGCCGPFAK